jgi:hypothetical protein
MPSTLAKSLLIDFLLTSRGLLQKHERNRRAQIVFIPGRSEFPRPMVNLKRRHSIRLLIPGDQIIPAWIENKRARLHLDGRPLPTGTM